MRLIDADKIRFTDLSDGRGLCYVALMENIKDMPTIETEGRECGQWEAYHTKLVNREGSPLFLTCNKCGRSVVNDFSDHWNYCPNCGAKMENENETDRR